MTRSSNTRAFVITLACLALICGILFRRSFSPEQIIFANDGPLGALMCASGAMPAAFQGVWQDLNWIGVEVPSAVPNTSAGVWMGLGNNPVTFAKFNVPISLICLGLSLWLFLRQFGFGHAVCGLAAIAACLNMNTFSHAAWGLPTRCWTLASIFVALAALRSGMSSRPIPKALIAGWAVGNAIMEGFDVGAIFSLYVAAFALFTGLAMPGVLAKRAIQGVLRTGIVAVFAALVAAAALVTLVGTQITGIAGMEQSPEAKRQRWDMATMWSLPKLETTRLLVPGLFGYRMDTPEGGRYWGAVGQSPGVAQSRHSGAGEYAGVLVVVLAAFGLASAFRKKQNPWNDLERKTVLFFGGAALLSLLLAWGRHAPFYQIIYNLPWFSTIRNPIKFMHPFQMCLLVLFGFGLEALFRLYVRNAAAPAEGLKAAWAKFWKGASDFERRWVYGSVAFAGASFFALLVYVSSRREVEAFLTRAGFGATEIGPIANFSFGEAKLGAALIILCVALVLAAMTRWFAGSRQIILVVIFGAVLTLDLMRANLPWIIYYDYQERYRSNIVFDTLRANAHEHRVSARWAPFSNQFFVGQDTGGFASVQYDEWMQHQFQYYNIQSLEVVQMPRQPELDTQYYSAFLPRNKPISVLARLWELTNTRYLLGDIREILGMALQVEGSTNRYRPVLAFDAVSKSSGSGMDWVQMPQGRFGVVEFSGALPRVSLYSQWQVTNAPAILDRLSTPSFDPAATVLLEEDPGLAPAGNPAALGTVRIAQYTPKRITLSASNSVPSILLYNDKYSPHWKVTVNGQDARLLRANFIMRGLPLPPGSHEIVLRYEPPLNGVYLSAAAILVTLAILGLLAFVSLGAAAPTQAPEKRPKDRP